MVVTVPAHSSSTSGPRPIDMKKDVPGVVKLLELVFGRALQSEGKPLLGGGIDLSRQPAFLWRLTPGINRLALGYVWEEQGRIIGNATVLDTKTQGRYLVVNVAVHPEFRRRGIARGLMNVILRGIRARKGSEILLQVEKENFSALELYRSLGFHQIGSVTTWRARLASLHDIADADDSGGQLAIRELRRQEWQQAYELDLTALDSDLNWPDALPADTYRGGVWKWLNRFMAGQRAETWVVQNGRGKLVGLAGIWSEWARPHRINMRVHPHWRGQLERPLLAKVLRRLHYLSRHSVRIDHPDNDDLMTQLLREAGFTPRRTLTHMRLTL